MSLKNVWATHYFSLSIIRMSSSQTLLTAKKKQWYDISQYFEAGMKGGKKETSVWQMHSVRRQM